MSSQLLASLLLVNRLPRVPYINENYLTDYQKQQILYDKCYRGKLFDESGRIYDWGTKLDPYTSQRINKNKWKPRFIPSLAKNLVETHTTYITGEDKFPTVKVNSLQEGLFPGAEPVEGEENPDKAAAEAEANALQAWVATLLKEAGLQDVVHRAVTMALHRESAPVLLRYYGGRIWGTVSDPMWCRWEYEESDPKKLAKFHENYLFQKPNPENREQKTTWLFSRIIDGTTWTEWEQEVKQDTHGKDEIQPLESLTPTFQATHGFTFVPVVVFKAPDDKSIFSDEVVENIKGHIEYYNDIRAGVQKNMAPQWATLKKPADPHTQATPPGQKPAPLVPGDLWELYADSLQSFSNQTEGYQLAAEGLESERGEIKADAKVIDIPEDNEQSGKALVLKMAPQYNAVQRMRGVFGEAIMELVAMILRIAAQYLTSLKLPPGTVAPQTGLTSFTVELDWGSVFPKSPDEIGLEQVNVLAAVDGEIMSRETAQDYLLPLYNVQDIPAERRKIAAEKAEREERELALADAAFDRMNKEEKTGDGEDDE